MSDLENRIEALEAKLGQRSTELRFRIYFVSAESHEASSALLMRRGFENVWFKRQDGETETAFLARVDQQPTDDIHPPKETQP